MALPGGRFVCQVTVALFSSSACQGSDRPVPQAESSPLRASATPKSPSAAAPPSTPAAAAAKPKPRSKSPAPKPPLSFTIVTLSRGKGVPPAAREALRSVQELVETDRRQGVKVIVETTRIGLEGETRTCVEYQDTVAGARAYERARVIVKGVDLTTLTLEPCPAKPPRDQE